MDGPLPSRYVVGKIAEAVLSVSGMNVRCTCKQATLRVAIKITYAICAVLTCLSL